MGQTLKWDVSYCIGNEELDEEHKKLFDLANRVLNINNPLMDSEKVRGAVLELYDYMRYHFEHEEKYMASISYAGLDDHKEIHQSLVGEINILLKKSKNFIDLENNLIELMQKWVLTHIIEEDTKIVNSQAKAETDGGQVQDKKN